MHTGYKCIIVECPQLAVQPYSEIRAFLISCYITCPLHLYSICNIKHSKIQILKGDLLKNTTFFCYNDQICVCTCLPLCLLVHVSDCVTKNQLVEWEYKVRTHDLCFAHETVANIETSKKAFNQMCSILYHVASIIKVDTLLYSLPFQHCKP